MNAARQSNSGFDGNWGSRRFKDRKGFGPQPEDRIGKVQWTFARSDCPKPNGAGQGVLCIPTGCKSGRAGLAGAARFDAGQIEQKQNAVQGYEERFGQNLNRFHQAQFCA